MEETLNALLNAEASRLCKPSATSVARGRRDTRAGHYERELRSAAGEVRLKVPKLRR